MIRQVTQSRRWGRAGAARVLVSYIPTAPRARIEVGHCISRCRYAEVEDEKEKQRGGLTRSEQMSRIRSTDSVPELLLPCAIWGLGLRYRLHARLPGRLGLVFQRAKVTVFVDGCFWHGCPQHDVKPRSNVGYWHPKVEVNVARDSRNDTKLMESGWRVLRFWDREVEAFTEECAVRAAAALATKTR